VRIAICGDDFGMNDAVDRGMVELAGAGRLGGVGCLTQGPSFARRAGELGRLDVELGVHLDLADAVPGAGALPALVARCYLGAVDRERVRQALRAQFDAFERTFGRAPDYVDGHRHIHQLPQVRDSLFELLQRRYANDPPALRCTRPGVLAGTPWRHRAKAGVIAALGARPCAAAAAARGWTMNRRMLGVYDFRGGERTYLRLLQGWLRRAREGDLLLCHPAAFAQEGDALGAQRLAEFRVLASDALPLLLETYGLRIAGLKALGRPAGRLGYTCGIAP